MGRLSSPGLFGPSSSPETLLGPHGSRRRLRASSPRGSDIAPHNDLVLRSPPQAGVSKDRPRHDCRHESLFSRHESVRVIRANRPRNRRGRRERRVPTAPMVRVQQKARGRTTGTGGSSGLPCAMVLRLIRDLPGDHAWLPPSSADRSAHLAPASERQDHTTSPSAATSFVRALFARLTLPRPSHPVPNVRDDRDTPLLWAGTAQTVSLIWGNREAEYLYEKG
jgi:hypothetical protein